MVFNAAEKTFFTAANGDAASGDYLIAALIINKIFYKE